MTDYGDNTFKTITTTTYTAAAPEPPQREPPAQTNKTTFQQVGINFDKWKMPSSRAIEEVEDSENHNDSKGQPISR